jgi:hypothetical protein
MFATAARCLDGSPAAGLGGFEAEAGHVSFRFVMRRRGLGLGDWLS